MVFLPWLERVQIKSINLALTPIAPYLPGTTNHYAPQSQIRQAPYQIIVTA